MSNRNDVKVLKTIEGILHRPNIYINNVKTEYMDTHIIENSKIILKKDYKLVYGLYKIIDEAISNVIDHIFKMKFSSNKKDKVKHIDIKINKESIIIKNFGKSIDLRKSICKGFEDKYNPEVIFTTVLSSTNYDDNLIRYTGGRNGYVIKLTSIFSSKVLINIVNNGFKYKQFFTNNLSKISKPKITKTDEKDYTSICFQPDFSRFDGCTINQISGLIQ